MSAREIPISDPFLDLDFFAKEFGKTSKYLNNISLAQRGRWGTRKRGVKKPYSDRCLRRYPLFIAGPGGAIGMYASQYREWREQTNAPIGGSL